MNVRSLGLVLGLTFAAACGDDTSQNPAPSVNQSVSVQDDMFVPDSVTVSAGATVTWNWAGTSFHDVTWVAASGPTGSPLQGTGSYQRLFGVAGKFDYYCSVHGAPDSGMHGTVVVQ